jgi:hypothetical protein
MKFKSAFNSALLAGVAPVETPIPETPKLKSGEQMLLESQNLAKFGERWKMGQQMVQQGEETVRQGRLKIEEGEKMIGEGNRIMRESEESYQGIKK